MSLINKDIDTILIQSLSIDDLRIFCQTNKYYNNIIRVVLQQYYNFFNIIDTITISHYSNNSINTLIKAVQNGKINICVYLLNKHKYDIDTISFAFDISCDNGNLNIAQLFHSIGAKVQIYNSQAFMFSCGNGHLNVAKWLHSIGVDNHSFSDHSFLHSCIKGHITVARWLHSLDNVNIRANGDIAFIWSCLNNHLDVAEWLCTLYSGYSVEIINGKIQYTIN